MSTSMEFWGVEVKAGEPLKVSPPTETIIHISQAALGESKKDKAKEVVPLFVKCGDQKIVIGTLSAESFPQISFDLVFEKDFELSHNWKNGSVFFCGYKVPVPEEEDYPASDFSDSDEEEIPLAKPENVAAKKETVAVAKPAVKASKPESSGKQVKVIEPVKDDDDDSSDDSDESEDDSDDDGSESGNTMSEDDDDDDESEDEEETPAKVEKDKKRSNDSAVKTPASKKAKVTTPQKTDGKKGGHTATPHPSKQAAKTSANGSVSKTQSSAKSPKSGGSFTCDSCSKSFGKEVGLQSHIKAKHA